MPATSRRASSTARYSSLSNVREQVMHVCRTASVWDAWERGRDLAVHGWVYGLADGLLRDLGVSVRSQAEFEQRNRFGVWSSERALL